MDYIEMKGITKAYSRCIANNNASLSIKKGEIHAVAGENGAGKSTIMKILYGAEKLDSGSIFVDGKKVDITSPKVANSLGIGMVYQHFMLVNEFMAWENIYFGIEDTNKIGVLKKNEMINKANELANKYDMVVDLNERCGDMSVSTAQKVEILKVLARGATTLILDEPTAVLTPQETEQLFKQLRLLKESGYTIIIITHKLKEIKELCDRITIMRLGQTIGTYNVKDVTIEQISELMVGRKVAKELPKGNPNVTDAYLEVNNLSINGKGDKLAVNNVSFKAKQGEILCFAGVEGNGQQEVIDAITGTNSNYQGEILINNINIKGLSIKKIRKLGLCHIPEDRMKTGCDIQGSIFDNLISLDYQDNSLCGFIKTNKLKKRSEQEIEKYNIKGFTSTKVGTLSGGNMQKVIVARELESNPSLIVADQPTRGVDIGAIEAIHKELIKQRDEGKAIVLVSADLAEVFALADRILVFHDGMITASINDPKSIDEIELGKYMLGLKKMEGENR